MTPLLLRNYVEGKELPPTLAQLLSKDEVKTEFHALCVVLHNLMMESGYKLKDSKAESFTITNLLVTLSYSHPGCPGLYLTLTCNPLGQYTSINGLIHRNSESD